MVSAHVGQLLRQNALRRPASIALRVLRGEGTSSGEGAPSSEGEAQSVSYAALDAAAAAVARALARDGVGPGDRVLLCAANGAPFVAAYFGALYAGACVVPVPVVSAPAEVAFRVEHARVKLALVDAARAPLVPEGVARRVLSESMSDEPNVASNEPRIARPVPAELTPTLERERPGASRFELRAPPDGLGMILYTSGTTGTPKGAAITHASLVLHTAALVHHTLALDAGDVVLGALPLTHSFGIRMGVLAPFYAGARVALVDRFDAERCLAWAAREGVTWLPAVPTMFHAFGQTEGPPLPALRWCLSAGAPLADAIRARAETRLGADVREGYGLTEATFTSVDAPPEPRTPGSVGRPVWGVEVVVRAPDGRALAAGELGEITVRGQNVMRGYLDDPAATRAVFGPPDVGSGSGLEAPSENAHAHAHVDVDVVDVDVDVDVDARGGVEARGREDVLARVAASRGAEGGWLWTGDLGYLDLGGRLFVVDRRKDLILRGGHNVYPSEVEAALATHPGVAAVTVVGVPDARLGEEVVAVLVVRAGATVELADLDAFARERLAKTKVPRLVAFVDALPLGPSRKVLRRTLRDALVRGDLVARRVR